MYYITEERVIIENEEHTVYGIKCAEAYVPNVSADRGGVKQLVELFNQYELLPCHLDESVEDFLSE